MAPHDAHADFLADFLAAFPAEVSRTHDYLDIPMIGEALMLTWGDEEHRFIYAKNLLAELFALAAVIATSPTKTCERFCRKYISEAAELDKFWSYIMDNLNYRTKDGDDHNAATDALGFVIDICEMGVTLQEWLDLNLEVNDSCKVEVMAKLKDAFDDLGVTRAVHLHDDEKYALADRRELKARTREKKTNR